MNPASLPTPAAPAPTAARPALASRLFAMMACTLLLIAGGLTLWTPAQSGYIGIVPFSTPDGFHLRYVLVPAPTPIQCQRQTEALSARMASNCPDCKPLAATCTPTADNPVPALFTTQPIDVPSGRFEQGMVLFEPADNRLSNPQNRQAALQACQAAQLLATASAGKGNAHFVCFSAGQPRETAQYPATFSDTVGQVRQSLLQLSGWLMLLLSGALLLGIASHWQTPASRLQLKRSRSRLPWWWEKVVLMTGDALAAALPLVFWPQLATALNLPADTYSHADILQTHMLIGVGLLAWLLLAREHYGRRKTRTDQAYDLLMALSVCALLEFAWLQAAATPATAFISVAAAWLFALPLILLARQASIYCMDAGGFWQKPVVIVGTGRNAADAALAISASRHLGMQVAAFMVTPQCPAEPADGVKVRWLNLQQPVERLTYSPELLQALDAVEGLQAVVALDNLATESSQQLVQALNSHFPRLHLVPPLRGLPLLGLQVSHLFSHDMMLMTIRNNLSRAGLRAVKRMFDITAGTVLLLLLSPVMLGLVWAVRRDGGPAMYGHLRIGQGGRPFRCLKFRSMCIDADDRLQQVLAHDAQARSEWARDFKLKNDPRVTSVGRFLRTTSLDELPQLFNVLAGHMSLVGPRPIIEAELARYGDCANLYLQARPGLTGLWQISGRNDTGYDERVALDAWYARNWSLWTDIAILIKTVRVVLKRRGAY